VATNIEVAVTRLKAHSFIKKGQGSSTLYRRSSDTFEGIANSKPRENRAGVVQRRTASQASDMGSIPIARSITPDDSTALTRLGAWKSPKRLQVLDGGWTVLDSIGRSVFTGVFAVGANRQRAFGWLNGTNTGLLG
jgi:hypothetical protein